jgi:hypothetical protein
MSRRVHTRRNTNRNVGLEVIAHTREVHFESQMILKVKINIQKWINMLCDGKFLTLIDIVGTSNVGGQFSWNHDLTIASCFQAPLSFFSGIHTFSAICICTRPYSSMERSGPRPPRYATKLLITLSEWLQARRNIFLSSLSSSSPALVGGAGNIGSPSLGVSSRCMCFDTVTI